MFFPVLCKKTERTGQEKAEKYGTGAMQEEEPHRRIQKHDIPARRNTGKERPAHAQKFFPGRRKATFSTFPISKISHIHGTPLLQARPMSFVRFGVTATAGNPDHLFSWVALEDLADALVFIMGRQDISGPVNVTAPERTTNREFYRAAAEHFHTRLSIRVPDAVLRLLMGEASQVITGGQCAVPETLMREGFTFQYPDIRTFFNKAFSVKS